MRETTPIFLLLGLTLGLIFSSALLGDRIRALEARADAGPPSDEYMTARIITRTESGVYACATLDGGMVCVPLDAVCAAVTPDDYKAPDKEDYTVPREPEKL